MRNLKVYDYNTSLDFGSYKGFLLAQILKNDTYILWCIENVDWFCVPEELLNSLELFVIQKAISGYKENVDKIQIINSQKLSRIISFQKQDDFNEYEDNYYSSSNNWLIDAAGTDDPETMNDVFWNLD
ncbi:hypothetical protein [Kaistella jeonii]|uniref:Uncharacterized protein n=1 Tax=Kaistella jeonii TaxID=266749 RepID=A0A0C1CYU3_9FLAO|nr:hypothetical protein [Kaistella jeonii]KIA89596.1 hypothetical protein OA86_02890 [Kaistella jeonii]SFB90260.1 hypothetical protein SAMN05421876_103322 [Kaistella jeonii]VEI95805.1 Uncharacterised protein [Kaistella jeonii]